MLFHSLRNFFYVSLLSNIALVCSAACNPEDTERILQLMREDETRDMFIEDTDQEKAKFVCVSLGYNCNTALHLNSHKLRTRSFPFDWNITSMSGLCQLLKNDFEDFLNLACLVREKDSQLMRDFIINTRYNLAFAHDFPGFSSPDTYLDYLEEITAKYQRRIERFKRLSTLAETIYFFRLRFDYWPLDNQPQTQESIRRLRDVLLEKFPMGNWVLVAVGTTKEYQTPWNMDKVVNFHIHNESSTDEWATIFQSL